MSARGVLVLLAIAVSCSGLNIEIKIRNDPQCKFKGQQCSSDLKHIIYCTDKNGDSTVVTSCTGTRKCTKDEDGDYACMTGLPDFPETIRNDTTFTCQGDGGYPDGYRCNIGYLCPNQGAYPEMICECPPDSAITFYPKFSCTTDKDVLDDCDCPYKNRCNDKVSAGDFGANCFPGYYYICKGDGKGGFEPEVHKCPDGQVFYEGACVSPLSQISSGSSTTNTKPVCKPYSPPCTQESGVKCTQKGELVPHRKIQRCYYYCTPDLKPIVRDCGMGSRFTCEYGKCGCVLDRKP